MELQKIKAFIKLLRPKQWTKNIFVFAALVFSKNVFIPYLLIKTVLSFCCFCLVSSCIYILNDILDVNKDKLHPKKRFRPIAAGLINKTEAIILMLSLFTAALIISLSLVDYKLVLVLMLYTVNNILYSFILKHIVIIDIFSIAVGFLLRVICGAVVIDVSISPWILLCTLLLSLFLGYSKRRNEIVFMDNITAEKHRKILSEYSTNFIDNMLSIVTASCVMSYSMYTFFAYKNKYMMLTIPFVLYGIFRYQYLVYMRNVSSDPDEMILEDLPFIINLILWVLITTVILYV